jgi:hypothetical protein
MSGTPDFLALQGETTAARLAELEDYFTAHTRRPLPGQKTPGRNDKCWCGSGKKYKRCHLRADEDRRLSGAPAGKRSMSDNLHAVVQPVLDTMDNPDITSLERLYTMAAAVWTTTRSAKSPAELVERLEGLKQVVHDTASGPLDDEDDAAMDDLLVALTRQAILTAPDDRRIVAKVQVTETPDGFRVYTASLAAG